MPHPPPPPPVRGAPYAQPPIRLEDAEKAVNTVKAALGYVTTTILSRVGPAGDLCVDIVLLYHGFALDRIHYDLETDMPSPKGRPVCSHRYSDREAAENRARELARQILEELWVVEAAEYRAPERAWVVPLAWRHYIVAHVKVSSDGAELIPDYGLTEEVRRYIE